jgi:hypothetical protein
LATTRPTKKAPKNVKPSRVGRVALASYQAPQAVRQLKILAAEEGTTLQALMAEALNLLFTKYGKPPIATP